MKLPIKKYPNKLLRVPGKDIPLPASAAIKKLADNMIDTVKAASGIGLAAPQVGQSLNLIVVNLEHLGIAAFPVANPKVISISKKKTNMEEGCLSVPGVYGLVSRPESIVFEGYHLNGSKFQINAEGLLSKVLQHETDHVNGILIVDKIKKYTEGKELLGEAQEL
jgi:peptide deformylase